MPSTRIDLLLELHDHSEHLASQVAFARSIVRTGRKARFFNVVDLVNELETEVKLGRQGRIADSLVRVDLVIMDELGYLPFAQSGGQLLFHLISRLYERTSIIVMTNLAFAVTRLETICAGRCEYTTPQGFIDSVWCVEGGQRGSDPAPQRVPGLM